MGDDMNYSLHDVNGDIYHIWIKKREAILYDQDHLRCYRRLNQLKRAGIAPSIVNSSIDDSFAPKHNSTMQLMVQHCPSPNPVEVDDLRSPATKKGRKSNDSNLNESFELLNCEDDVLAEPLQNEPTTLPEPITTWTEEAVHLFINEMGKRIDKIKMKRTPRSVYTEISLVMLVHGFKFDGDALYSKKRGLDTFFCKAKKKPVEKQAEWPYFDGMNAIHAGVWPAGFKSIPRKVKCAESSREGESSSDHINNTMSEGTNDMQDVEEQDENHNNTATEEPELNEPEINEPEVHANMPQQQVAKAQVATKFEWTDAKDAALIEEVDEARQKFDGNDLLKNVDLFNSVAQEMKKRGIGRNGDECMKRFTKLKIKFYELLDKHGETGRGACKWSNFEAMHDLEGGSVSAKAPKTVSLGAVPKVTRAHEIAATLTKGRQRQPNATRQDRTQRLMGNNSSAKASGGAIGFKNRALDIQERRLELEREYFNEFKTYRLEARERGGVIKEGVQILKDLKSERDLLKSNNSTESNNSTDQ